MQNGRPEGPLPQPLPLPVMLTETTDPTTRELAFAAQRYGKAAQRDPGDFEAVYNHGLALQELALRAGSSRKEQQDLLIQVTLFRCCRLWQESFSNIRVGLDPQTKQQHHKSIPMVTASNLPESSW